MCGTGQSRSFLSNNPSRSPDDNNLYITDTGRREVHVKRTWVSGGRGGGRGEWHRKEDGYDIGDGTRLRRPPHSGHGSVAGAAAQSRLTCRQRLLIDVIRTSGNGARVEFRHS